MPPLTPAVDDPNRKAEMERRARSPEDFGVGNARTAVKIQQQAAEQARKAAEREEADRKAREAAELAEREETARRLEAEEKAAREAAGLAEREEKAAREELERQAGAKSGKAGK